MRPLRLACLSIPFFPLAAHIRSRPELRHEPLLVLDGKGSAARIIAAAPLLLQAGIRPGFSLPQARALVPHLICKERDREAEKSSQQTLLEVAQYFSPRIEEVDEGLVYLDLCGEKNEKFF